MRAEQVVEAVGADPGTVVVGPPGPGAGNWAGAPSVVADGAGVVLAYRLRRPVDDGRGYANVIARSDDGVRLRTVATVPVELFAAASLERPALVRRPDGGWRLYVSCSAPGSKQWWVEALDADTLEGLLAGRRTVVLPGDDASAWKDVVVHVDDGGWRIWACRHLLADGDAEADRMQTWYGEGVDGLSFGALRPALLPTAGTWDARGARLTSVWRDGDVWQATYDGRATAEENWYERTGWATGAAPGALVAGGGPVAEPGRALRYVAVARTVDGVLAYVESGRADGANELRVVRVPG